MYKKNVSKKRKTTSTYKKPYKKSEKTNKWAPKVSTKEYKYMDNILQSTSCSTATLGGTFVLLNNMIQGAYTVQRIGNVCKMKTLHFKGFITANQTPVTVPNRENVLRFIILYDAQPNGAIPAIGDILKSLGSGGAENTNVFSSVNISNRTRFTILRDYIRCTPYIRYDDDNVTPIYESNNNRGCGGGQASDKSGQIYTIDDYIQINMPAVYNAKPVGDVTDIKTGALYLLAVCGAQAGNWGIQHESRLTFKEEQTN